MKNLSTKIILSLIFISLFINTSCSKKNNSNAKKSVVCTTFPLYDWTKNIVKEDSNIEVTLLMTKGSDLHNFQPSVNDLAKISSADLFIYNGGESDEWCRDAIKTARNKNLKALNICEILEKEGREALEHEHHHEHEDETEDEQLHEEEHHHHEEAEHEEGHHHHEHEKDEHVWLSVKNAEIAVSHISEEIKNLGAENTDAISKNTETYLAKLYELDKKLEENLKNKSNLILVADRFPFIYLFSDYNLNYCAPFSSCSTDSEASFDTIVELGNEITENNLNVIYVIENSDKKIANSIIQVSGKTDVKIETLWSMQSVTQKDIENGASYCSFMENNIEALLKAL